MGIFIAMRLSAIIFNIIVKKETKILGNDPMVFFEIYIIIIQRTNRFTCFTMNAHVQCACLLDFSYTFKLAISTSLDVRL